MSRIAQQAQMRTAGMKDRLWRIVFTACRPITRDFIKATPHNSGLTQMVPFSSSAACKKPG